MLSDKKHDFNPICLCKMLKKLYLKEKYAENILLIFSCCVYLMAFGYILDDFKHN